MPLLRRTITAILAAGIVLAACAACSPLNAINALTPSSSYIKSADISYGGALYASVLGSAVRS